MNSLEAKVVILGAQGAGKTSLVVRFVENNFHRNLQSTIGASFLVKKVQVDDCIVRLQIWDTAGQERFRSMAPMYYRGANAAIICYDITSAASWNMVDTWLQELRRNMTSKLVIHLVGGKLDLCLANPALRQVPFEQACAYAAENLDDFSDDESAGQDLSCHEVSAKDDTGVEEVFLAISRKLVEQREEIEDAREALMYGRRQYTSVHPEDTPRQRQRGCPC